MVIDEWLCVNVCVEDILIESKQVDDLMRLGHKHKVLALHVEHPMRVEVVDSVVRVLCATGGVLAGVGFIVVDGQAQANSVVQQLMYGGSKAQTRWVRVVRSGDGKQRLMLPGMASSLPQRACVSRGRS